MTIKDAFVQKVAVGDEDMLNRNLKRVVILFILESVTRLPLSRLKQRCPNDYISFNDKCAFE